MNERGESGDPGADRRGPTFVAAIAQLRAAALARAIDEPDAADRIVPLIAGRFALRPHTVDRAVDAAIRTAASDLLARGWRPTEVVAFAAGRLDPLGLAYLRDALTGTAVGAPPWLEELPAVGDGRWWSSSRPHLEQWSARHGCSRAATMRVVVDVLALLAYLPRTDAPLPGMPHRTHVPGDAVVDDERVAGRIDALLARAGRSGYAEEAAACAVKAQELLLRYAATPEVRRRVLAEPRRLAGTVGVEVTGLLHRAARVFGRRPRPRPRPRPALPAGELVRSGAERA